MTLFIKISSIFLLMTSLVYGSAETLEELTQDRDPGASIWADLTDIVEAERTFHQVCLEIVEECLENPGDRSSQHKFAEFDASIVQGENFDEVLEDARARRLERRFYGSHASVSSMQSVRNNIMLGYIILDAFSRKLRGCRTREERCAAISVLGREFCSHKESSSWSVMRANQIKPRRNPNLDDAIYIHSCRRLKRLKDYAEIQGCNFLEQDDSSNVFIDRGRLEILSQSEHASRIDGVYEEGRATGIQLVTPQQMASHQGEVLPREFRVAKKSLYDSSFARRTQNFFYGPTRLEKIYPEEIERFYAAYELGEDFADVRQSLYNKLSLRLYRRMHRETLEKDAQKKKAQERRAQSKKGRKKGKAQGKGKSKGRKKQKAQRKNFAESPQGEGKRTAPSKAPIPSKQEVKKVEVPKATLVEDLSVVSQSPVADPVPETEVGASVPARLPIPSADIEEIEEEVLPIRPIVLQLKDANMTRGELEGYYSLFQSDSWRQSFSFTGKKKDKGVSWNTLSAFLMSSGWTIDKGMTGGSSVCFMAPEKLSRIDGFKAKRIVVHKPKETKALLTAGKSGVGYLTFFRRGFENMGLTKERLEQYIRLYE